MKRQSRDRMLYALESFSGPCKIQIKQYMQSLLLGFHKYVLTTWTVKNRGHSKNFRYWGKKQYAHARKSIGNVPCSMTCALREREDSRRAMRRQRSLWVGEQISHLPKIHAQGTGTINTETSCHLSNTIKQLTDWEFVCSRPRGQLHFNLLCRVLSACI